MASAEVIAKLETKAVAAEKLIELLRQQISQVKAAQVGQGNGGGVAFSQEIVQLREENSQFFVQLREENSQLKSDVETWKAKLSAAEVANGKKGCCAPAKSDEKPKEVKVEAAPTEGKEKKVKADKPEKAPKEKKEVKKEDDTPVDIGRLDLRVGHIRKASKHPDADSLYVEEIDLGEEKPRTVISGLVKFIPEEEMQDRMAIILCNLKPSKMRGIMSEAMVMCASTPEKVEIMAPPAGSKPGDLVQVDGYTRNPDSQLNPKKKIFEACAPDLKVNDTKQATYKGVLWTVNGQPVTSQTLVGVQIK
eukprot:GFUD01126505.1.p1 GENE.GFUD01126505.1~~GFUD01126505.1.p1  ORF type:complete len:306 (-),score=129.53 GFUD01126505.1:43-960(-)